MISLFAAYTNPLVAQFREDKLLNDVLDESTESFKDELKKFVITKTIQKNK